jgi:histidinol-phosphate aminotransferase
MSRFWSKTVQELTPYVPGEQPKMTRLVKLNTNESPYGPSLKALSAIREVTNDTLRLYPDPNADALKQTIAAQNGLDANHVFAGNGSDEVLAHIFAALLKHDHPVLFPDITYSFYPVYCKLYGISSKQIPLDQNLRIRLDDYINEPSNGGIIFPNPNAPTGQDIPRNEIRRLLENNRHSVVVIDEAYVDFGAESCIPLVKEFDNLVVVHTLSKSRALAGLRVGFALGHPDLIEALERIKNSFNSYPLDRLAIAGAIAAIEDTAHLAEVSRKVQASREKLVKELSLLGFETLPSQANFVFTKHPKFDAEQLAKSLREQSIIVRHFKLPRIDQYLRITIGKDEECMQLIEGLKKALG